MSDTYKVKTMHDGLTRVYIPELTEEEREKRMKGIRNAAARLVLSERK